MRKNLKKESIDANKLAKDAKRIALPAYDSKFEDRRKKFTISQFWCTDRGNPSKRAFFLSLFAWLGAAYAVFAAVTNTFNGELGMFIIGCITTFGVAYHKSGGGGGTSIISSIASKAATVVKNRIPLK